MLVVPAPGSARANRPSRLPPLSQPSASNAWVRAGSGDYRAGRSLGEMAMIARSHGVHQNRIDEAMEGGKEAAQGSMHEVGVVACYSA